MLKYVRRSKDPARKIGIIFDTHDHREEYGKGKEVIMPNYYIVTVKPRDFKDPRESWGFKDKKNADRLKVGDKMVSYVAENCGFESIMEVIKGEPEERADYPHRVKVKVECQIKLPTFMPKWKNLKGELTLCQGKNLQKSGYILHKSPLISIDEHDYKRIANEIYRGKERENKQDSSILPQKGISAAEFVEQVRELLRNYDKKG